MRYPRQRIIGVIALILLIALWVYWWVALRPRPAPPLPPPADAAATITGLLRAAPDLQLTPDQVTALRRLQSRLAVVLQPLQAELVQAQRRLQQLLSARGPRDPATVRQAQVVAGLAQSERQIQARYRDRALAVLTARQRARLPGLGIPA